MNVCVKNDENIPFLLNADRIQGATMRTQKCLEICQADTNLAQTQSENKKRTNVFEINVIVLFLKKLFFFILFSFLLKHGRSGPCFEKLNWSGLKQCFTPREAIIRLAF